jgi:hypothetical protein
MRRKEREGRGPAGVARLFAVVICAVSAWPGCARGPSRPDARHEVSQSEISMATKAAQSYLDALDRRDAAAAYRLLSSDRRASLTPDRVATQFAAPQFSTRSFCVSAVPIASDRVLVEYQVNLSLKTRPTTRGAVRFVAECRREANGEWRVWEIDLDAARVNLPPGVFPDRAAWNQAHLHPLTIRLRSERETSRPRSGTE